MTHNKYGKGILLLLAVLLCAAAGCIPREDDVTMKKPDYTQITDCLYAMELDDYEYTPLPPKTSPAFRAGCSSVRQGDLYGRNLDLYDGDTPEFVILLHAAEGRYASLGVCADPDVGSIAQLTAEQLWRMPNITNDGINENGVIVSENVVDATGVDQMDGTAPGGEQVHASRVVRYLLDRARSASHAVELMKKIDIVGGFSGYALHWMIADETDTYTVEIVGGELAVRKNEFPYMTNFYLNTGAKLPEQTAAGRVFSDLPPLTDYAMGVERFCILRDGCDAVRSAEDMRALLASVRASAMYDGTNTPPWYSECVGGDLTVRGDAEDFRRELAKQTELYRGRDDGTKGNFWITWHTSVYEIESRTLHVWSREEYTAEFTFSLIPGRGFSDGAWIGTKN